MTLNCNVINFQLIDFIYCNGLKSIATRWVVPMGLVNSSILVNTEKSHILRQEFIPVLYPRER